MANEKQLIYLEDAKEALIGWETDPTDEEIEWTLDQLQKVDAVPVVRGRCKWCNGDYHTKIVATAIRYHTNGNMDGCEVEVNYCPNCGEKMDGDGNA